MLRRPAIAPASAPNAGARPRFGSDCDARSLSASRAATPSWSGAPVALAVAELLPAETRIVIAAMRPRLCRLGGAVADGVLLNWMLPDHLPLRTTTERPRRRQIAIAIAIRARYEKPACRAHSGRARRRRVLRRKTRAAMSTTGRRLVSTTKRAWPRARLGTMSERLTYAALAPPAAASRGVGRTRRGPPRLRVGGISRRSGSAGRFDRRPEGAVAWLAARDDVRSGGQVDRSTCNARVTLSVTDVAIAMERDEQERRSRPLLLQKAA
jgi:hypothetical protein